MIKNKLKLSADITVGMPEYHDKNAFSNNFNLTYLGKIHLNHEFTIYVLNYLILSDSKSKKTTLTIRTNDYKEFSNLTPKVRKIDKIYVQNDKTINKVINRLNLNNQKKLNQKLKITTRLLWMYQISNTLS